MIWKLVLQTKFSNLLTTLSRKVIQNIKKFFEDVHLETKIYFKSSATVWNSTTDITTPKGLTSDFTDFLKKCLNKDERDRWSAPQLLEHTWIKLRIDHLPVQSPIQSTEHYIILFYVLIATLQYSGPSLERVPRVHGHPLKFGNGCRAPVLIRVQY